MAKTSTGRRKRTKPATRSVARKKNPSAGKPKPTVSKRAASKASNARAKTANSVLLAGGNPQITKAEGDAPVQAYIEAMPGWKQTIGRRLDSLIVRTVPDVRKAVKWNSPFYGVEGQGWFLGVHCMTKYVKVAFFNGISLSPRPPVESKQKNVRYLDIREDDTVDEKLLVSWISQASKLPGWTLGM